MLRITELSDVSAAPTLRVEGHITQQTVEELMSLSTALLANHRRLLLDLSGVRFIDAQGATALRQLRPQGAVLTGCSGFVSEFLRDEEEVSNHARSEEDARETALIEGLRHGDEGAFEQLVREHGGRMLATARRFLSSEDDARDVVQDALLSAFKSIATFSATAKLSTWLHRIVVNAALMKIRTRRRRPEQSIDDLLPCFDERGEWVSGMTNREAPNDVFETRETRQLVRRCIDRLPQTYRAVLLARDIEDLDTAEVADLLHLTPNAVKIRLHRARQALRALLEREFSRGGAILAGPRHKNPKSSATASA